MRVQFLHTFFRGMYATFMSTEMLGHVHLFNFYNYERILDIPFARTLKKIKCIYMFYFKR